MAYGKGNLGGGSKPICRTYPPYTCYVDSEGNYYVLLDGRVTLEKYDSNGVLIWSTDLFSTNYVATLARVIEYGDYIFLLVNINNNSYFYVEQINKISGDMQSVYTSSSYAKDFNIAENRLVMVSNAGYRLYDVDTLELIKFATFSNTLSTYNDERIKCDLNENLTHVIIAHPGGNEILVKNINDDSEVYKQDANLPYGEYASLAVKGDYIYISSGSPINVLKGKTEKYDYNLNLIATNNEIVNISHSKSDNKLYGRYMNLIYGIDDFLSPITLMFSPNAVNERNYYTLGKNILFIAYNTNAQNTLGKGVL